MRDFMCQMIEGDWRSERVLINTIRVGNGFGVLPLDIPTMRHMSLFTSEELVRGVDLLILLSLYSRDASKLVTSTTRSNELTCTGS